MGKRGCGWVWVCALLVGSGSGLTAAPPLSESEIEGLTAVREEEKLARDVYQALYEVWGQPIFSNIAAAEATHMEAIRRLIDTYGLSDPVTDDARGVFSNAEFAELYEVLVQTGSASLVEAYKVGAMIEEMDIVDIRQALAAVTHSDIQNVYENLMRGSRNHLRAFAKQIKAAGETYEAQFLTQEEFDAIAESPREGARGRRGRKGR
jgi:hypothetical protein